MSSKPLNDVDNPKSIHRVCSDPKNKIHATLFYFLVCVRNLLFILRLNFALSAAELVIGGSINNRLGTREHQIFKTV
jgi:hypothetical protein